jgi:hypothetical protein
MAGVLEAEARRLGHQGLIRMRMWDSELFYGHFMSGSVCGRAQLSGIAHRRVQP